MRTIHPADAARWSRQLSDRLGRPVEVLFGRARHRMVVAQHDGPRLQVRLNEGFRAAPSDVREALVRWLEVGRRARRATRHLRGFLDELAGRLPPPRPRRERVEPAGRHHDLAALARELAAQPFAAELGQGRMPRLTWGRRGRRTSRRSLELGSFDPRTRIVRLHPVLDQACVPRFFVRFVLAHELLHALLEPTPPAPGERRRVHGREFRARERALPDHRRALAWQERHIGALLRAARTGRALRLPPCEPGLFDPD